MQWEADISDSLTLTGWLTVTLRGWLNVRLTELEADWQWHWEVDWVSGWLSERLTDSDTERLTECQVNWVRGWLMVRLGCWLRVRAVHPFGLVGQCQLLRESFTTCIAGTTHFKTNVKLCKTNYVITCNGLVSWMGFHPWNWADQLSKSRFLLFGFGYLFHWNTDAAIAFFFLGALFEMSGEPQIHAWC